MYYVRHHTAMHIQKLNILEGSNPSIWETR
jgi:hypothetical protein